MHHGDGDRGPGTTPGVGERQVGRAAHGVAEHVAEPESVDERRAVLDLARGADHGRLAVGLNGVPASRHFDQLGNQEVAQAGSHVQDGRSEVFDEALAGPRVGEHRGHPEHAQRRVGGLSTLYVNLLGVGDDLAHLGGHGSRPGLM